MGKTYNVEDVLLPCLITEGCVMVCVYKYFDPQVVPKFMLGENAHKKR